MIKNMYQLAMQTMKPWGFRPTRILSRCSNRVPVSDVEETGDESSGRHTTELRQNYGRWKIMYWYGLASGMVYLYLQFHYKPPNFGFWDWYIYICIYSNYSCSLNGGIRLEALNHIRKMMFKGQSSSQHHINTTCNMFLHAFFSPSKQQILVQIFPNLARWDSSCLIATRTSWSSNFLSSWPDLFEVDLQTCATSLPWGPCRSTWTSPQIPRVQVGFALQSMASSMGKLSGMEWAVIFQAVVHWNFSQAATET